MFNKKSQISASVPEDILQKYFHSISNEKIICRAPFTSLYFSPDGEVGACCLNKGSYFYGKYPEQSINEIIKSVPRKLHQKHIKANNLLLGCNVCQENIISGNFSGVMAFGYKNQNIKKNITRIDFELSNQCNLNCIMCERDKSHKDGIYGDKFIDEIKPLLKNLEFANFIGGEPFIIEIYYKIWDLLIDNPNCIILVQTNGTVINDRILYYLNKPNFFIGVSIDAIKSDRYKLIRKGADFKLVLQNFEIFNSAMKSKNHQMQISVCPMRINWIDIPDLLHFANLNKCLIFFNQVEYPDNLSLKQTPSRFLLHIIQDWQSKIELLKADNNISKINIQSFNDLISLVSYWKDEAVFREENSVIVSREKMIELLKNEISTEHKDFFESLVKIMPDNWMIGNERLKQIAKFDFDKQFKIFNSENKTSTDILTEAKRFLEINRIENLTYE